MILLRAYIGATNMPKITKLVAEKFDNATLFKAVGLWHGNPEGVTVIEVLTDEEGAAKFEDLCAGLKTQFKQEEVLLVRLPTITSPDHNREPRQEPVSGPGDQPDERGPADPLASEDVP